jgi:hypothetical protein
MTTKGQGDLVTRMTGLLADPGYQNELAQVRAKATLQAIGSYTQKLWMRAEAAYPG